MQPRRSSCSCMCAALLLSLWLTWVAAAQNTTASVTTDLEFQRALQDPQVSQVVLVDDIQLQAETWQREDSSRPAVVAKRNITISSRPPHRTIDFAFLASNWLKMASGTRLNISNTILKQSRYGVGMALDFLAPSPGAVLVLWNSTVVRHLCVDNIDEPEAITSVPRIPEFPGEQRAHWADYCFRDMCFERVIVYDDFTKFSTATADTAAGGYALALVNVSKVCRGFVDKCRDSSTAEACMQRAIDGLPHAAPTPGRIAAAQEAAADAAAAASQQRQQRATLGAAIGAGVGFCLLLALLAGVLVRHKRKLQQANSKADGAILPLAKRPGSPKGQTSHAGQDATPRADGDGSLCGVYQFNQANKDVHVTMERDTSSVALDSLSSRPVSQLGSSAAPRTEQLGPPSAQDTWELAAWKTSTHSLRRLQQQQPQHHSADDLAISFDSGLLNGPVSVGPHPRQNKVLTSHELILQGTGLSTSPQMIATNKISLGVVIGAGSFGKVYKGKWRGADVAVKVVQHSQAAAATVANEIDLMMSFQHPHLVSAYHFVTWRRRKDRPQHYSGDQVLSEARQASVSSESLICGVTSNSLPGGTPGGGMGEEDMQTYIVQEYCDAGNLGDYSIIHGDKQEGELPTGHAMLRLLFRLREVAEGMQFLHDTARVVHGDLKSNNILLCIAPTAPYGRTAKVADFGLARVYQAGETHKSTKTLGTVNHMAPELLRYGKASTSADVYSYAIMCWELLTGEVAFKGWQWGAILEHVALGNGRPPVPEGAPEDFVLLLETCWHQDPAKRPTFQEVLTCINIMITSRQQELIEQAAGVSIRTHTMTAAVAAAGAVLHMDEEAHVSHNSTGPLAMDVGAGEPSTSSYGEWDIVRVGSMRQLSGASNATNRSSPAAPRTSSKHLWRTSHSGQLPPTPQQQGWHPAAVSASFATTVLTEQDEAGEDGQHGQGQMSCPGAVSRSDSRYGPQHL